MTQATARQVLAGLSLVVTVATALLVSVLGSVYSIAVSVFIVWSAIAWLIVRGLADHPFDVFGMANTVTAIRAAGVSLLAGTLPVAQQLGDIQNNIGTTALWSMCALVALVLLLDGVDGYLARKFQLESAFGARFDMEVDALLALVITAFLWRSGKLGPWVLGLGAMRYLFILASIWAKPLQAPLFPSLRRKTVCVIQITALCLMLSPLLDARQAMLVGAVALLCLGGSFLRDILWLYRPLPLASCINKAAGKAANNEIKP